MDVVKFNLGSSKKCNSERNSFGMLNEMVRESDFPYPLEYALCNI